MGFRNLVGFVLGGAFAAAFGLPASAGTINFEDVAQVAGTISWPGDVTSGGYSFDASTNFGILGNNAATWMGSTALVTSDFSGANVLTMTEGANATFGLVSADFAEAMNNYFFHSAQVSTDSAITILVTGYLFGGGTVTKTVTLDLSADGAGGAYDGQNEVFNWSNLTSVTYSAASGPGSRWWGLDNIVVTAVPLPAAAWMGMVLLGGIGVTRFARRRLLAA